MPRARKLAPPPLDQRIGRALLSGRDHEGLVAIEGGAVAACNAYAGELLGCEPAAVEGQPVDRFIAGLDGQVPQLRFQSALLESEPVEFVVERPHRTDEWIEVRGVPLNPGMAFLLKDVTDRERSERSLRRKEQRLLAANLSLRLAHGAARAASWEWRRGRSLRWLDLAAARELEALPAAWTEDEEIADWRDLMPSEGRPAFDRAMKVLAIRGAVSFEIEVTGADDARHWMRIDCAVTDRDASGDPSRVSGVTIDVTQSRLAAQALRDEVESRKRSEQRQQLLVHELNHRVKNMLATVQSVARRSLSAAALDGPARDFEERLMALAWTYEILTREHWEGASLREVLERTLAPHLGGLQNRLTLQGPALWLTPNRALSFALAFHELATNAIKYGALSNEVGQIRVSWNVTDAAGRRTLELEWVEQDGPPVTPPVKRGFGSRLIERNLARELDGGAKLHFAPGGLRCWISAPLSEPAEAPVRARGTG